MTTLATDSLDSSMTLARWATERAAAARVFARHRLDFCCKGGVALDVAARERGLDPEALVAEILLETSPDDARDADARFALAPLPALIDHILEHYHAKLREELPRLRELAAKVESKHGSKPECPRGLRKHLDAMEQSLGSHMEKEETVLFPLLRAGRGSIAEGPISVMEMEHEEHARDLARTRQLTADFVPPEGACNSWRALYLGLEEMERDLMRHVHLENHVLFPRALRG